MYTDQDTQSMEMKIRRKMIENLAKDVLVTRIQRHTNHRKHMQINHLIDILTKWNVARTNNSIQFTFSAGLLYYFFRFLRLCFWEMNICATRSVSYATPFSKLNYIWSLWLWMACDDTICVCLRALNIGCICICAVAAAAAAAHKIFVYEGRAK